MSGLDKYLLQARLWRRHLHQHPELSHQEFQTSAFIKAEMSKLANAEVTQLTPTSVLVAFKTGLEGTKIGLCANIDALPIQEERPDLPFASQSEGIMHACGHDGHAAVLMAVCSCISDNFSEFTGEIYAIFQHAGEGHPSGATELVATRFFDDFDFIYGQHLMSTLSTGFIDIKNGACSANTDNYYIKIRGTGKHATIPDQTIDPILIGAQFVTLLQNIVSRHASSHNRFIVSNTIFKAGNTANIIPECVELAGTVETASEEARSFAALEIDNILRGVCLAAGATYEYDYERGCNVTLNHPVKTETVRQLAQRIYSDKVVTLPSMLGGEDFSEFSHLVPATFVVVGAANTDNSAPHHHPKFGLDEDSFSIAFTLMLEVAYNSHLFK